MRPFIINAHLGEEENQVLLFIPASKIEFPIGQHVSLGAILADRLSQKGYEVIEYKPCSVFFGKEADADGGYAITIVDQSYSSEKQLLEDAYQICNK